MVQCVSMQVEIILCMILLFENRNFYLTQFGEDAENLDETGILEMDLAKVSLHKREAENRMKLLLVTIVTIIILRQWINIGSDLRAPCSFYLEVIFNKETQGHKPSCEIINI